MCRQQVDLDRRLMRMAVSDRDMCVHQLQRKSMPNNSIAPLELSTQLQIEPKRSERKSIWQIASSCCGSFSLTNRIVSLDTSRCVTCHLPPVCQPASESPSAALWLLSTMAKAKKKREKKCAKNRNTNENTYKLCLCVNK